MHFGMVAGEASGDILGAGLLNALKISYPNLQADGIGGYRMQSENFKSLHDMEKLAVIGLIEPLKHLPSILRIRRELQHYFLHSKPDVFIGIDSPDFNLGLELALRRKNIPVVHYVSPSVWAWRQKRIFKIAKAVDLVLTLFPFETAFYEKYNVPAQFVGHPLADLIPLEPNKTAAHMRLELDPAMQYVALLPGSRQTELKYLAEPFLKAAELCLKENPNLKFITSAANQARLSELKLAHQKFTPQLPLKFFLQQSHDVMAASDVILVASGTATLEAMLFKKPMVIAAKLAWLTYQIALQVVKIPFIGLPNLLANEMVVPELIQHNVTPENLSRNVMEYFKSNEKTLFLEKRFLALHKTLKCDANQTAANAILKIAVL